MEGSSKGVLICATHGGYLNVRDSETLEVLNSRWVSCAMIRDLYCDSSLLCIAYVRFGTIHVWNLSDLTLFHAFRHESRVCSVYFKGSAGELVSVTINNNLVDGAVHTWSLSSKEELLTIPCTPDTTSIFCSGDCSRIVKSVHVHDNAAVQGHPVTVQRPAGFVQIWDSFSGAELGFFQVHDTCVVATAANASGNLFATASSTAVRVWDMYSVGTMLWDFQIQEQQVRCTAFHPDGDTIAIGVDKVAQLWNLKTGEMEKIIFNSVGGSIASVSKLSFSPDGTRAAAASDCQGVVLIDVTTDSEIQWDGGATAGDRDMFWDGGEIVGAQTAIVAIFGAPKQVILM